MHWKCCISFRELNKYSLLYDNKLEDARSYLGDLTRENLINYGDTERYPLVLVLLEPVVLMLVLEDSWKGHRFVLVLCINVQLMDFTFCFTDHKTFAFKEINVQRY